MSFRFRPDSPDLFEPPGSKLTSPSGSLLQSAGIELTVSEMRVVDEEAEVKNVAYVFKPESRKGISFKHESGELIQLLDNSERFPMGRKNIQLREVQAKLNRCQVQRVDADKTVRQTLFTKTDTQNTAMV